jgi:hypothetical protein
MDVRTSPVLFAPAVLALHRKQVAYAALVMVSSTVSVLFWRDQHNKTLLSLDRALVLVRGACAFALVVRAKSALAAALGLATLVVYAVKCAVYAREKRSRRASHAHTASSRIHSAFHILAVMTELAALRYS